MQELWKDADITDIETRVIRVERSYDNFDEYWSSLKGSPSMNASTGKMSRERVDELKERVCQRLPTASDGSLTLTAWALLKTEPRTPSCGRRILSMLPPVCLTALAMTTKSIPPTSAIPRPADPNPGT